MRLIDADATIYALNVASRGDSKDVIRNLVICFLLASPTVDAIPISFIEELIELSRKVGADHHAESLEILLTDWAERKEENGK